MKDPEMVFSKKYFMYGVLGVIGGVAVGLVAGLFIQWLSSDVQQLKEIDCSLVKAQPDNYWNYTKDTVSQKLDLCKAFNLSLQQQKAINKNAPIVCAFGGGAAMILSLFITLQIHLVYKPKDEEKK